MFLKDYYRELEIEPSASPQEIKRAYRQLAQQFHPDKTGQDPYASARFAAIKEAYETLTNPLRKQQWLEQRWYQQSLGRKKTQEVITPLSLLKQVLELEKYVSRLDTHRMDRVGLMDFILELFNAETIAIVNGFAEPSVNKQIVELMLRVTRVLSYKQNLLLADRWIELSDEETKLQVQKHLENQRQNYYWEKYKPLLLAIVVIIICLLIFLLT